MNRGRMTSQGFFGRFEFRNRWPSGLGADLDRLLAKEENNMRRYAHFIVPIGTRQSPAPVPTLLGTASSFAVLAGSTVTNTGPSTISGSLGLSPGSSVTGFPPGGVSGGTIQIDTGVAVNAQSDPDHPRTIRSLGCHPRKA